MNPADQIVIVVDARPLTRGAGGIQRYLQTTLPVLINHAQYKVILYSDHPLPAEVIELYPGVVARSVRLPFLRALCWHVVSLYWLMKDQPSVFWSPRQHLPVWTPRKTRTIVTIHDLVWKTHRTTMPRLQWFMERILMPLSLRRADRIIAVSDTTRARMSEFFPGTHAKSTVIKHAMAVCQPLTDKQAAPDRSRYYLSVGTIEPRKNYPALIQGFSDYVAQGGQARLLIVGKKGWHADDAYQALATSPARSRIEHLENVSDADLWPLYSGASGYVSVSLEEGFGLPILEAQSFGLPLAISNIATYRELFPDAAVWLNENSPSDISVALKKLDQCTSRVEIASHAVFESEVERCRTQHRQLFNQLLEQHDVD